MLTCPQCGRTADSGRLRLVQDSCGHRKCRECLLSQEEESGCWSCASPVYTDLKPVLSASEFTNSNNFPNDTSLETRTDSHQRFSSEQSSLAELNQLAEGLEDNSTSSTSPAMGNIAVNNPDKNPDPGDKEDSSRKDSSVERRRQQFGLKEHIVFTPGDPPMYHCKVCRKSYNNRKAARYHNYCGLPDDLKPYRCDVCGQGFVTSGHFAYHMKSHTGLLPFLCDICDKGFKQSSKLKRHKKSHEGEKPFKCEKCSRVFSAKHVLKDHLMTHSGNHTVSCPVCCKKLSSKSCLRKHRLLHSDPTHRCDDCGKKFPVKWNLEMHKKTHMRDRKYKCKLCNRAFKISSDLKRHAAVHLEDGEWDCKICNLVFRRKDNLVRHLKNIHPESQLDVVNNVNTMKSIALDKDYESVANTGIVSTASPVPQAVSVIRGTAVPVIKKMSRLEEPSSILISAGIRSAFSKNIDGKDFQAPHEIPGQLDSSSKSMHSLDTPSHNTLTSGCASSLLGEAALKQSTALQDQNCLRESVVCHSDSRGIVHHGSAAFENLSDSTTEPHERTESVQGANARDFTCSEALQAAHNMTVSAENRVCSNVWRPRVIVKKA